MRKVFLLLTAFSFLVTPAFAMPSDADSNTAQLKGTIGEAVNLNQPIDLGWGPVAIGFGATGDFVLDRNLEGKDTANTADLEAIWYGGNVYFDPINRVHLNLFVGVAGIRVGRPSINNNTTAKVEIESETGLAGGGSGKVDIYEFSLLDSIGITGQPQMAFFATGGYRYTNLDADSATPLGSRTLVLDTNFELHEWQAGGGVSQRINWEGFGWVFYVGGHYSDVDLNVGGTTTYQDPATFGGSIQTVTTGSLESEEVVGVFCGLQVLAWEDRFSVAVEGRFVDETAVSVNGHLRW